jgi:excisionase family DNA binding protein
MNNRGGGMKLVDVQIAADFLGVSRQTIGRMIEGGALTAVPIRTGKRKKCLRIPDSSLKKFLGIPQGQLLIIEPALIHKSTKRTVSEQSEQEEEV